MPGTTQHVKHPDRYRPPFTIMHTNVDGAGYLTIDGHPWSKAKEWEDYLAALEQAERLQREADKDGNGWGYHYHVYAAGIKLATT